MTDEHKVYEGNCICGAISYQVVGKPIRSAYCHCTLCQRLSGSAFIHTIHYPVAAFKWTHGEPQQDVIETYSIDSKPWKIRSRCKQCGCCVSSHNTKTDRISVWGAQLERDEHGRIKKWEDLKPKAHIFYGTRMLDVHDSLAKWEGYDGESESVCRKYIYANTPAMSTFRVSPWVSYNDHLSNIAATTMDDDVDMDAPQISILRDEDSPPPQRKAGSRKQKASPKKVAPEFPYLPRPRKENLSDVEYDEPEEEEDQLIDDDDEKPAQTQVPGRTAEAGQKRKVPSKRKSRKTDKKADEEKKGKEKQNQPVSPMTVEPSETEPPPLETMGDTITVDPALNNVPQSALPVIVEPGAALKPPAASKKKAAPRKPPAAPRQRAKITNDNEKLKITIRPVLHPEDIEVASEGGLTGTAASSPMITHIEPIELPDLEFDLPAPLAPLPLQEETISLDNVPIPVYPLPSKPFSVQPAPKLNTGAAPIIPLDKSGKKVRHWRMANREIRGIAGGRWFARTWVGEKESEFAVAMAAAGKEADEKVPKGSSISAPVGKGSAKTKGSKNASLAASASASAAPSRDGSLAPDVPLSISAVRNPTKMRITLGPEEYAD